MILAILDRALILNTYLWEDQKEQHPLLLEQFFACE